MPSRSSASFHFAGKPIDLSLLCGRGGWIGIRGTAFGALLRFASGAFDVALYRFAACFGAPLHRVPCRLRGIVAGRRLGPEVAYSCGSNKSL